MQIVNLVIIVTVGAAIAFAAGSGGAVAAGAPVVWWCAVLAFGVQWVVFVPAYLRQTDRFFDLTGSFTYLLVMLTALVATARYDARSVLLVAMVGVWALRLGSFLFRRVHASGGDRRFERIKTRLLSFLLAWTLQGLWVLLTASAALAAITAGFDVPLGALDAIGFVVWCVGMTIEAVADNQKRAFRADPENRDVFITTGLWSWSRHPNYFGEILLWLGVAIMASPTLEGWRWVTLISPIFVYVLLTRISGVPMLERRADKRWGGEEAYEEYKARTAVLIPRPPAERSA
jgi:steroid 5-alpha reductase family enzyme